tara:strand:+ start:1169 stop:1495 length:327 start_codon:yes stop_codon:yes gene_type:complete
VSKLYFPDRALIQAGFDQQTVEFFRGLFLRTGGSLDPSTLDALEAAVTALQLQDSELNQSVQVNANDINAIENQLQNIGDIDSDKSQPVLIAQMNRLNHRINQLEDAQ